MSLDLSLLKQLARSEVLRHIETGHQDKDLIIEFSLMKPLERIIGVSALKERGVSKIYALEDTISSQSSNVIYIISPDILSAKSLINHIRIDIVNNFVRNRWVLFYPGRNIVIDYLLETEGVMGDVHVEELELNFIPIESEVLSMEYPLAFKLLYVNKTHIPLFNVARALFNLQNLFGKIPKVYTVGKYSAELIQLFKQNMFENLPSTSEVPIEIGQLIIIDRNIDPVTVCSSQLTFEGLLSDVYTIKSGFIKPPESNRKIILSDQEHIFNEIRNLPLSKTAEVLKVYVEDIQEKQKNMKDSSISDMKKFINDEFTRLKSTKQNVDIYLNLCENIIKKKNSQAFNIRIDFEATLRACDISNDIIRYIEWIIVSQQDILPTLKFLCLWSCTKHTTINKNKRKFIDLFLQSYGFEHLSTFYNLERSSFFVNTTNDSKFTHKNIIEDFQLIPGNETDDNDISYVFGGKYRPLSSTIIEKIVSENFPRVDCSKYFDYGIESINFCSDDDIPYSSKNIIAVLYLGGICHTEISCLKIISRKYDKKIITLTTAILNGSDIMEMHLD